MAALISGATQLIWKQQCTLSQRDNRCTFAYTMIAAVVSNRCADRVSRHHVAQGKRTLSGGLPLGKQTGRQRRRLHWLSRSVFAGHFIASPNSLVVPDIDVVARLRTAVILIQSSFGGLARQN